MAKDHEGVLAKRSWHGTPNKALEAAVPQQVMHYRIKGEVELEDLVEFEESTGLTTTHGMLDQLREYASAEIEFCIGPVNWRDT